ncbi:MAG: hypothetical protein NVSMB49_06760 [Ktedonobacteraceae bacterium]
MKTTIPTATIVIRSQKTLGLSHFLLLAIEGFLYYYREYTHYLPFCIILSSSSW